MELETKSKVTIRMQKIARKKVFAELVASKECRGQGEGTRFWRCCNEVFKEPIIIYKHISREHCDEIEKRTKSKLELSESDGAAVEDVKVHTISDGRRLCQRTPEESKVESDRTATLYSADAVFPWLPAVPQQNVVDSVDLKQQHQQGGQVLLFYHYVKVEDPHDICRWQKELCTRLNLHGKIRIAEEGLNGTVGGSLFSTQTYVKAVMAHPTFSSMEAGDFKTSHGGKESFPDGLVVSVHQEVVPMGKDPREVTPLSAGVQRRVILRMEFVSIRKTCPIHLHLVL
ncbi:thiosulfate sulfurtransferase/rhodanese-like domain-containing protein 2, partial [Diadema antillarum]|uniref:thiosulfate sulfurtransferase/rhodanese-like domain-containing protein 2 n=1 Tax=Diadema antillarum TaxID=105358 RepID=UPI003A8446D2